MERNAFVGKKFNQIKQSKSMQSSQINQEVWKKISSSMLLAALVVSHACTKKYVPPSMVSSPLSFATRDLPSDTEIITIELKSLSILESLGRLGSELKVDEKARLAVLREQENFEKKLKKVAPNARVLFRFRMGFNGLTIMYSRKDLDAVKSLPEIKATFETMRIEPPTALQTMLSNQKLQETVLRASSTEFIGAAKANREGITGKGIRVGVVDTGIDYTHKMLGGSGNPEDFEKNDPTTLEPGTFPNAKVIGGFDFVGDKMEKVGETSIPKPDPDPLDRGEHGTHVAGSIAGNGDGIHTYDGVAPDAKLYALKVFPEDGGAADYGILAALEFAADPNGDLDPSDHLDVLNLSLGSDWGASLERPYPRSLKSLEKLGTAVIMAAGNAGNVPFIVGAPSTLYEGQLSVAASTDDDEINYVKPGAQFKVNGQTELIEVAWSSSVKKPGAIKTLSSELVYMGLAAEDFSTEEKNKLQGKIALIDRGQVSFQEKVTRALDAKALAVVIANSKDGDAVFVPQIDEAPEDFPIVMISKNTGDRLKALVSSRSESSATAEPVMFTFDGTLAFKKPELIDRITGFSSRGPRLGDGLIKPQIAAPGANILSAQAGSGDKGVRFSGTSMASPHVAGVMALLKQIHPQASIAELNARMMNTAFILRKNNVLEDVSRQGAGRILVDRAIKAETLIYPQAISLGFMESSELAGVEKTLTISNKSQKDLSYTLAVEGKSQMVVQFPEKVTVAAGSTKNIKLRFRADVTTLSELDGFVMFKDSQGSLVASVPYLGLIHKDFQVRARFNPFNQTTILSNQTDHEVEYLAGFKRLGVSPKERLPKNQEDFPSCDLRSASVRKIERLNLAGERKSALQFALSFDKKQEHWILCDTSVQIDVDNNQTSDFEAIGITDLSDYVEKPEWRYKSGSVLLDFAKARDIVLSNQKKSREDRESFEAAVVTALPEETYAMSSLRLITVPTDDLKGLKNNRFKVKIATIGVSDDDFVSKGSWIEIDMSQLTELTTDKTFLRPKESQSFKRTQAMDMIYLPNAKVERGFIVGGGVDSVMLK